MGIERSAGGDVSESRTVSVVVPAYNEEQGIGAFLDDLIGVLKGSTLQYEIIVVDDGSTDETTRVLEQYAEDVIPVRHPQNRGYGAALKSGIVRATYDTIVIIDADLTYPTQRIPELVGDIGEYDMVVGARTGQEVRIPALRRPAKWFLNVLASYLAEIKIPDLNSGLRAFKKTVAMAYFGILPNSFSFTTTITLSMLVDGFLVKYVPIDYRKRAGRSKIKPSDAFNFLVLIIRTIMYFNPLRVFLPISLGLLAIALLRVCYDIFILRNITDSSTLFVLSAVQIGLIGMVADLVVRVRKGRPDMTYRRTDG